MPAKKRSYFSAMVGLRCPRCRRGKLFTSANPFNFKKITDMPHSCPVCGQDYSIEPGFYFGATYVSYALNVAWLVPLFILMRFVLGLEYKYYVITMFVLLPILIPLISRISRAFWLSFFVKFDPQTLEIEDQLKVDH
ncbi:MAG: DUF983 domain-containing protein [Bacteroidia bacterium]|nr:DUF983 domain-containing protein [Bacteroidia bacterium]